MTISAIILYIVFGYLIWWAISRLGLLGAWVYSKPGTLKFKHYAFIVLSCIPGVMETVSTMLIIFGMAAGFDSYKSRGPKTPSQYADPHIVEADRW